MNATSEVLSPELVLISAPEVAAEARRILPDPLPGTYAPPWKLTRKAVALFYVVCLAGTLGPLALAAAVR